MWKIVPQDSYLVGVIPRQTDHTNGFLKSTGYESLCLKTVGEFSILVKMESNRERQGRTDARCMGMSG